MYTIGIIYTYTQTHKYPHTHTHARTHARTHTHTHTHTNTHTNTYIELNGQNNRIITWMTICHNQQSQLKINMDIVPKNNEVNN